MEIREVTLAEAREMKLNDKNHILQTAHDTGDYHNFLAKVFGVNVEIADKPNNPGTGWQFTIKSWGSEDREWQGDNQQVITLITLDDRTFWIPTKEWEHILPKVYGRTTRHIHNEDGEHWGGGVSIGYIHGTMQHKGPFANEPKGFLSANKFEGYTVWFKY